MLSFFRRYQKFLFIFVTVMIVISFTFFGTFSTFLSREEIPNQKVGKALDGRSIMSLDIELINRFLRDGAEEGNRSVNLLNGSFIHQEFLSSPISEILVESYWEEIKGDLESRFRKAKQFSPYVHPHAPFLSAKLVWERFSPEMNGLLEELKGAKDELSLQTFSLLRKLYLAQTKLPPHMLKQILLYQQNQYSWIKADPALMHDDFALFGFHSVEDWFGPKFQNMIAQFLINTAAYAEQKGYKFSKEEAKAELIQNAQKGLALYTQGKEPSLEEARGYYYQTIQSLGMDESKVSDVWKKVMGFKRLFQESARGILLDPLSLKQFHAFTRESAEVNLYRMPVELRFLDARDLGRFQVYLESVSAAKNLDLGLPRQFLTPELVEKRVPELVQKRFQVKLSKTRTSELAGRISLKETWEWQLDEANFSLLKEEFPLLALEKGATREARFEALEKCDPELRFKIDEAARAHILKMHPEWIEEALSSATGHEEIIALKLKGGVSPLEGIEDLTEFLKLLETEDPKLHTFHPNEEIYYRIQPLKKSEGKEILTFAEARTDGTLDKLLDQKLEAAYPELRKKNPAEFQQDKGWKPFEEVKEKVAALLYTHRADFFHSYLARAKAVLEKNEEDGTFLREEVATGFAREPLERQWLLVKEKKKLKREKEMDALLQKAFQLKEGEWSSIINAKEGDLCFFRLIERVEDHETSLEEMSEAKKPLVLEAEKHLMKQLLDLFPPFS